MVGGKAYSLDPIVASKEDISSPESSASKKKKMFFVWTTVILLIMIVVFLIIYFAFKEKPEEESSDHPTLEGEFKHGAVASDGTVCSAIGRDILKQGGTAVDALVATEFCLSVVIPHSTGIGGGGFMVIYKKSTSKVEFMDFRETAPAFATELMYVNASNEDASVVGGQAIAVPGFVKGLYTAWFKHGKIHWRDLVQPAIKVARDGYKITGDLYKAMKAREAALKNSSALRELFFTGDKLKNLGDTVKDEKQAKTLERIRDNPTEYYYGPLAEEIVKDIQDAGGNITLEDLRNYKIKMRPPIRNNFQDFTLYGASPPSSTVVVAMVLNILRGYNFKPSDLNDAAKSGLTYHRIVEAFKFGYAWRALLGDPAFNKNITETYHKMLNASRADEIRKKIDDAKTYNETSHYGGYYANKDDQGTSHTSILAANGDAVACTTTVNLWFGSRVKSNTTGILYNNEMDDFSTPNTVNAFGFPASKYNYIAPGKRPMSSMSPSIVIDKNGDVRVIAGGSGGSRIITGTSQVIMNALWFGRNAVEAVLQPRLHHQLLPDEVRYMLDPEEYRLAQSIRNFLESRGHKVKSRSYLCHTQAITRDQEGSKFAMSDPRKDAKAAGY